MATGENKVQSGILTWLHEQGIFAWRQNNQAVYDQRLGHYRSHTGLRGVPDIIAVIDGRFIGIECKTKTGKQSSHQALFQKRLENNGGLYILARSVKDVQEVLTT